MYESVFKLRLEISENNFLADKSVKLDAHQKIEIPIILYSVVHLQSLLFLYAINVIPTLKLMLLFFHPMLWKVMFRWFYQGCQLNNLYI